jgi:hypothetical protein
MEALNMATNRQALADTVGVHVGILDAIGLTDRRYQRLLDRVDADKSRTRRDTQDAVLMARQLASAEHKLRRRAAVAFSFWRSQHQQADRDEYLQATADATQCRDDLAELLCHDEALIAEVMRRVVG